MARLDATIKSTASGSTSATDVPLAPHLFVALECGRPLAGGASLRIEGIDEIVVGRAETRGATIEREDGKRRALLGIPDGRMSGRHARLSRGKDGWTLTDLGSTNGTFLDAEKITEPVAIADGDMFDCGNTIFLFRAALPPPPVARILWESDALPHRKIGLATLNPELATAAASLARVATSDVPVLLLGETGTGKEVTARAVHTLSRRTGAFVPVNCGALPETLLESQLFGHVKGSFSGATKDELGLVRASDGGTLFLDEIGDMPRPSQVALLRVLQEKEVTPVGATKPVRVDLRVVAATHRPVEGLEDAGFRGDLYARVAGYTHRLAPVRDRMEDLGLLVADTLKAVAPNGGEGLTFALDLGRALVTHEWPLNVRELAQALRVTALLAQDGVLRLANAPESLRSPLTPSARPSGQHGAAGGTSATKKGHAGELSAEDAKLRDALVAQLSAHAGNVTHVATEMGRTRMQIHRWMKRFGLSPDSYRK